MAKKMTKRMKPILETVHETAEGLHDIGLMDMKTMREFDALCLPPIKEYNAANSPDCADEKLIRTRILPEYIANEIYDILIKECAAHPNNRDQFVEAFSSPYNDYIPIEYRFGGKYGMAGKFWWNNSKFYTSGWSRTEVKNPEYREQEKHLEGVNTRLAEVYQKYLDSEIPVSPTKTVVD